ncbi:MAG: DUF805 domain-containing protein, partial [Planctomycetota bacterium]
MIDSPRSWFRIRGSVSRREYATVGFCLAVFKYVIESIGAFAMTGRWMRPWEAVNPWLDSRAPFLNDEPLIAIVWLVFTLPFIAISVSMSARRAADAGWSPWIGFLMLIPILNLAVIAILLLPPHREPTQEEWRREHERRDRILRSAYRASAVSESGFGNETEFDNTLVPERESHWGSFLAAIGIGCVTQVVVGMVSVWMLREYGFLLFFSAPVIAGATSGFTYSTAHKPSLGSLLGMVLLMNLCSYVVMLCVGLDGAICLAMAFPLLLPLSCFGAIIGSAIATAGLRPGRDERFGMYSSMLMLPLALILEPLDDHRPMHAVRTSVVIDASPETVWEQVIAFPEIDSEPAWFFKFGIAMPVRARIEPAEGTQVLGVGACRYCEFSTGPFVEPITKWQPPTADRDGRLCFDVVEQPLPMKEWTPISGLHPPHLDDGFVSHRGQFEIERLPDGKTRLVGTTWYSIDVRPRVYWKLWADSVIGAIHLRVLEHIRKVSEVTTDANEEQNTPA